MTCVIAMHDLESPIIHMTADVAISNGVGQTMDNGHKLVRFDTLLVGFAGSLATWNVMQSTPELTALDLSSNEAVQKLFDKFQGVAGFQYPGAKPDTFWGEMLLAQGNTLITMANCGGWTRVVEPVHAIGSGALVALGSWNELGALDPQVRLRRAIAAAAKFMPGTVSATCDYDHT